MLIDDMKQGSTRQAIYNCLSQTLPQIENPSLTFLISCYAHVHVMYAAFDTVPIQFSHFMYMYS
jgi:hypothetical protein